MSKKVKGIRKRKWVFTWNGYNESSIYTLHNTKDLEFYCGEEIGENGNKHLQGFIKWKNAKSMNATKSLISNKIHLEKMRGNDEENMSYCGKEGKVHTNMKIKRLKDLFDDIEMYDWQKDIIRLLKEEPDNRTINWYWEKIGKMGKSALARHLIIKHNALVVGGCARDILYGISEFIKKNELKIVIIDIARSQFNKISYNAIEQIKNGFFYNTKYESGMTVFNAPHVIVFANDEPDYDMMSRDRWNTVHIGDSLNDNDTDDSNEVIV